MDILGRRFGTWFEEGNLTEDYEVSMKIARLGGKQKFMLLLDPKGDVIATREYFPADFGRSVRQKTRWTTGIGLQTMLRWGNYESPLKRLSWKTLMARYGVWRDRKALWANPLVFLAWSVILVMFTVSILKPEALSSVSRNNLLSNLMFLNLVLFGLRLLQRWRFTTVLYGFQHGLLTIPRLALGSVINGMAAIRAVRQFGDATRDNKQDKIIWDKTEHFFPTEETIDERRNLQ